MNHNSKTIFTLPAPSVIHQASTRSVTIKMGILEKIEDIESESLFLELKRRIPDPYRGDGEE